MASRSCRVPLSSADSYIGDWDRAIKRLPIQCDATAKAIDPDLNVYHVQSAPDTNRAKKTTGSNSAWSSEKNKPLATHNTAGLLKNVLVTCRNTPRQTISSVAAITNRKIIFANRYLPPKPPRIASAKGVSSSPCPSDKKVLTMM